MKGLRDEGIGLEFWGLGFRELGFRGLEFMVSCLVAQGYLVFLVV